MAARKHEDEVVAAADERERAATAAALAAEAAAHAETEAERKRALKVAPKVEHAAKKAAHGRHEHADAVHQADGLGSDRSVRILGRALAALFLVLAIILVIGSRYGTRSPVPGHHGKTIACNSRYRVICF
jgi:hypothetical protein